MRDRASAIADLARDGAGASAVPGGRSIIAAAATHGVLPRPVSVLELAVLMLGILAIDWLWPALEIHDLQPSPYWLPVLLLAAQYGTVSGALAVIVAIAFHFNFATFPEQGVGENEFAYRLRTLSQPILWIAAALLLGQFRMTQIAAKRELSEKVLELDAQRQTLADYAHRLRTRCDLLEREIAGRPLDAARHVLAAFGGLATVQARAGGRHDTDAVRRAITGAFAAAYPGAAVSLFVRGPGGFALAATTRAPGDVPFLDVLPSAHPLAAALSSGRDGLHVLDAEDEGLIANQGLAAVPVLHHETGAVVGMIKLERGAARLLDERLTLELSALARAVEPLLEPLSPAPGVLTAADTAAITGGVSWRRDLS